MCSWWRQESRTTEAQLALLRQEIQKAEVELIEREAELIELRVELSAFRLEYEVQVGRKLEELDRIEALISHCKRRIQEYRQWGGLGPPKIGYGREYISVEEQYRRTWREPSSSGLSFPSPPANPETIRDLRKFYRQLCHRFHPDLTQDSQERKWRTDIMAAVNAAYEAQSLTELQSLASRSYVQSGLQQSTDQARLEALQEKFKQIQNSLNRVNQEIRDLIHGSYMELSLDVKLAEKRGQDLLAEMGAEVDRDLAQKRAELDFLQAQLRQLGIECG
jgi:hypothetical protein